MPFLTSTAYAATSQFRGDIGAMIVDSDPVVKLVLLVLFLFSIFSWGIIIQKWFGLSRARKRAQSILESVGESGSMVDLLDHVDKAGDCPVAKLFYDAQDELSKLTAKSQTIPLAMLENVGEPDREFQRCRVIETLTWARVPGEHLQCEPLYRAVRYGLGDYGLVPRDRDEGVGESRHRCPGDFRGADCNGCRAFLSQSPQCCSTTTSPG